MRLNVATLEPRYRRFRAELRLVTRTANSPALLLWMQERRKKLAAAYMATGEGGGPQDYIVWVARQYLRARRVTP
jgi:hypothetical protein